MVGEGCVFLVCGQGGRFITAPRGRVETMQDRQCFDEAAGLGTADKAGSR